MGGGPDGDGLGGGIFVNGDTAVTVSRSTVTKNHATGSGGSGQGVGGGVYSLGLFIFDADTSIRKNRASTGHDEIFS